LFDPTGRGPTASASSIEPSAQRHLPSTPNRELDAAFFRLYGLERDDVDHVMDMFPIVRRKDEAAFGGYRTKRLILERFDALAGAVSTGKPYETVLVPPPADTSVAHDESTRPASP
jgi:hypothetical protein